MAIRSPIETAMIVGGILTEPWRAFFNAVAAAAGTPGPPGPPGPGGATSPWVTDAFAASYTADISLGWNHQVTASANIAVNVPTGGSSGQPVNIRVIQDSTGGRAITLASGWKKNRPDPGYQEATRSCLISGIFIDASNILVTGIVENIQA